LGKLDQPCYNENHYTREQSDRSIMKVMKIVKLPAPLKFLSGTRPNDVVNSVHPDRCRLSGTSRILVGFYYFIVSLFIVVPSLLIIHCSLPIFAEDEIDAIGKQIAELEKAKQMSEDATRPLEAELGKLDQKLADTQAAIQKAGDNIILLEQSIKKREDDFDTQYRLLSVNVESYYKRLRGPSPFYFLLSSQSASNLIKDISYQGSVADEEKKLIAKITQDLLSLEADKKKVELDKSRLAALQTQLDSQATFFRKEVKGAKEYQASLSKQIADLTAKQQALLAAKTGTFQTSVGDVPLADDPSSRPDYNPGFSPAFAAFSFGAPHFKGMSQYGAFGRAKSGQNYETILKAYYGDVRIETVDSGSYRINTDQGTRDFENDYMKGIAEMPSSWAGEGGMEALKAQAIAARSYALAYVSWRMGNRNLGGSICTSESCQVYNSGKVGNPDAAPWRQAVDDTRGKILVSNSSNEIVNTWYASTSGGYQESYSSLGHTTPAFWDTPSGRSGWTSQAWEKVSGSPWFYKGWYKSRSGNACNRAHPWLSTDEMADIINAVIVYTQDGSSGPHLSQTDTCLGEIPDTWSKDEVATQADKYGGRVSSISNISVVYSEAGTTAQVKFNTNRGEVSFDGQTFYKVFNLRAPGAIHLTSGLYNIERK
jgi:peptidoglycan hydrolase-like amidase/peptidoglycan hydrolase CwlO-like protein